ncbi:NAD(P)H-binding protein [Novosphingobium sp.]|uniref:NAD(P)H-binding protein n=1 Tax=Novosphingobium sp. TaxID=1874826 RepID=UPI003D09651F
MSDAEPVPLLLVGATGLIGSAVIAATATADVQLAALARREIAMPAGARLEMLVADPAQWAAAIVRARPASLAIALGTTIKAVGGDARAFRAVDHDLVIACARAAREAGARQAILVSSAGADAASRNFYLSVKGETEAAINKLGFARVDILRPGMLIGPRTGPSRPAERAGQILSPLIDLFLRGSLARYRSVPARAVAAAILALAGAEVRGRHVHYPADIHSLALRSDSECHV